LIDFTYKEFESEKSINDYIKDPNYMQTEDRPGICFGFIIEENSISDFDIKIFQNDNRQERVS